MAMVTTIHGDMDESLLDKHIGSLDNEIEYTVWTEYRMKGANPDSAPIHRSVHVTLKLPLDSNAELGV